MRRILEFAYGLTTYLLFLATFGYAAGFLAPVLLPKTIDTDPQPFSWAAALVNVGLLSLFALQHGIMARPAFKRRWARIVPARLERNTFVLATCLVLGLLFWQWRAIDGVIWDVQGGVLRTVLSVGYWLGIGIVFVATVNIDHFSLFGLRQALANLKGRPHGTAVFHEPGLYRYVRHPIMLGFLIAFWSVPTMTVGHLLFSAVASAYIFVAVRFLEEPDLLKLFGQRYEAYRRQVGAYLPWRRAAAASRQAKTADA
jgi:protein-S-isoprenylcysteine O-methyltransferase Ste14